MWCDLSDKDNAVTIVRKFLSDVHDLTSWYLPHTKIDHFLLFIYMGKKKSHIMHLVEVASSTLNLQISGNPWEPNHVRVLESLPNRESWNTMHVNCVSCDSVASVIKGGYCSFEVKLMKITVYCESLIFREYYILRFFS